MRKLIGILFFVALLGSGLLWNERVRILEFARNLKKERIPVAISFESANGAVLPKSPSKKTATLGASSTPKGQKPPDSINLAVPFTPQAPHGNWDQPYQDACEEASVAMVHYFYSKKTFTPDIADKEILDLVAFEQRTLGSDRDTTAEQTAEFAKNYYGYKNVEVVSSPTAAMIKDRVSKGYPVIVPAYGRALGNPYFTPPGPAYHMLVIKGFTEDKFITNDPGTRRGADYLYNYQIVMDAIHDWNGGDVQNGRKVMIVIHPN